MLVCLPCSRILHVETLIHIHMDMHTYTNTWYVCIWPLYTHTRTCIYLYAAHTHAHTCIHTCIHTQLCTCTLPLIYKHTYVHIPYAHTYIHLHTFYSYVYALPLDLSAKHQIRRRVCMYVYMYVCM